MNAKRLYYGLIGVCVLGVALLLASSYYGNKILSSKAKSIQTVHADLEVVDEKTNNTVRLQKKVTTLADVEQIAQKIIPKDKDQTSLLAQIYDIAKSLGITLNAVNFTSSGKAPSATTQTDELKEAKNIRVYPFTTSISCTSTDQFIKFLERLEVNRRKAQVASLSIVPIGPTDTKCSSDKIAVSELKIEVYLKNEATSTSTDTKTK